MASMILKVVTNKLAIGHDHDMMIMMDLNIMTKNVIINLAIIMIT